MSLASDLIQRVQIAGRKLIDTGSQSVGAAQEFVRKNPVTSAVAVSGGVLAGTTITQIIRKKRKATSKAKKRKPKARKAKPRARRKVSKKKRKPVKKKWYGKTRTKKIYKTKKGQPYVLLKSGKARFIKKSRATRMRKTKGGYR